VNTLKIRGIPGVMSFHVSGAAAFPGATFQCGFPEAIGDAAKAVWYGHTTPPRWEERDAGVWHCAAEQEGELAYTMLVTPYEDYVHCALTVTNTSRRIWKQSLAFNCVNPGDAGDVRDHECRRHWVGHQGQLKRLIEIPRVFGPRPAIQLYSVEGAPLGKDIPFVANFKATPDVVLEGWMAIQTNDEKRLLAVVSKPSLFLFQNMEYSCIHSAPGFGRLAPGETGRAWTRIYFLETSLEAWHNRVRSEKI